MWLDLSICPLAKSMCAVLCRGTLPFYVPCTPQDMAECYSRDVGEGTGAPTRSQATRRARPTPNSNYTPSNPTWAAAMPRPPCLPLHLRQRPLPVHKAHHLEHQTPKSERERPAPPARQVLCGQVCRLPQGHRQATELDTLAVNARLRRMERQETRVEKVGQPARKRNFSCTKTPCKAGYRVVEKAASQ